MSDQLYTCASKLYKLHGHKAVMDVSKLCLLLTFVDRVCVHHISLVHATCLCKQWFKND